MQICYPGILCEAEVGDTNDPVTQVLSIVYPTGGFSALAPLHPFPL